MGKSKRKSKSKSKSKRAVRGPQLALKLAKGEPPRTARIRYVEPPGKKDGNPFFALRVPGELLEAFKKYAAKKGSSATVIVRDYMSKVTGIAAEGDDE